MGQKLKARTRPNRSDPSASPHPHIAQLVRLQRLYDRQNFAAFQRAAFELERLLETSDVRFSARQSVIVLNALERAILPHDRLLRVAQNIKKMHPADKSLDQQIEGIKLRQNYRRRQKETFEGSYTLISIGLHCLPWLLPNRWGFRTSEQFASTFNPFCLSHHKYRSLVDSIGNDFADYAPPEKIMSVETKDGLQIAARRQTGTVWNHHIGSYWSDNGFAELLQDLGKKVDAFRSSARDTAPVFLMSKAPFLVPDDEVDRHDELREGLRKIVGSDDFYLLFTNQQTPERGLEAFQLGPKTAFFYCPFPNPNYKFDSPERNTPEGLAFERAYAQQLRKQLQRWGLIKRRTEAAGESGAA